MQKFVVKKSKSTPLATTSAKQPLQMTKTALVSPLKQQQIQKNNDDDEKQISPSNDNNYKVATVAAVTAAAIKMNATKLLSLDENNLKTTCCRSSSNEMSKKTATTTTQGTVTPTIIKPSKSPSLVVSNVKMSGYLKKKRNMMGGWKKLWFVLQNQLLLSYSSKEDYERKLAPFKDVLNLVPGTIIRPTKGPRFTIETSTNLIYTFRCDNTNECSEWITALVESLGLNTGDSNKLANASSKLHFSMENLSKGNCNSRRTTTTTTATTATTTTTKTSSSSSSSISPASSFMSSRSCDSIYRGPTIEIKAKPIQQNLFSELKSKQQQQSQHKEQNITRMMTTKQIENQTDPNDAKCNKFTESVLNFRLHPNAPENRQIKQSYEVYQINRMFDADSKGRMLESNVENGNGNGIDIGRHGNEIVNGDEINEVQQQRKSSHRHHRHHHHHHHHHHRQHHRDIVTEEEPYLLDKNFNNNNLIVTMATTDKRTILANGNCSGLDKNMDTMTLDTNDNENDNDSDPMQIQRKKSAASSIISTSSSTISTASTASASKFQLICNSKAINGVINESSDDNINDDTLDGSAMEIGSNDRNEPIYAVVNLKNKYENRARKRSPDQLYSNRNPHKERPNSFHVISSSDYEEILNGIEVIDIKNDENIYEPISIPELTTKGPLWRYFSKINIDTLMEAARWKKEQQNVDNENTTTFGDMRKRFGQHRKSLKNRMKNFYNRNGGYDEQQVHKPNEYDSHNDLVASSLNSGEKIHRIDNNNIKNGNDDSANKKDKHLFYSMLKKSRTSLSFDDAPRKRIIMAIGGGNVFKSKSSRNLEVKKL